MFSSLGVWCICCCVNLVYAEKPIPTTYEPLKILIGEWKCSANPTDRKASKWKESHDWQWKFSNGQAQLTCKMTDSPFWNEATLIATETANQFTLLLSKPDQKVIELTGTLTQEKDQEAILTLASEAPEGEPTYQLIIKLLHENRITWEWSERSNSDKKWDRIALIGATKLGEPFAKLEKNGGCVVTGGAGSIPVKYKGITYYVCCSGCKEEFLANPEEYIK